MPDVSFSRKIYLKSQADSDGILNGLHELDTADIYRQGFWQESDVEGVLSFCPILGGGGEKKVGKLHGLFNVYHSETRSC